MVTMVHCKKRFKNSDSFKINASNVALFEKENLVYSWRDVFSVKENQLLPLKTKTKRRVTVCTACADAVAFVVPTVLSQHAPFWCQHKPIEEPKVTKSLNLVVWGKRCRW